MNHEVLPDNNDDGCGSAAATHPRVTDGGACNSAVYNSSTPVRRSSFSTRIWYNSTLHPARVPPDLLGLSSSRRKYLYRLLRVSHDEKKSLPMVEKPSEMDRLPGRRDLFWNPFTAEKKISCMVSVILLTYPVLLGNLSLQSLMFVISSLLLRRMCMQVKKLHRADYCFALSRDPTSDRTDNPWTTRKRK